MQTIHASIATRCQHWWWVLGWVWEGSLSSEIPSREGRSWGKGSCTVRSNTSWVMVTGDPTPDRMMDIHNRKHYLPATSFAGGNIGNDFISEWVQWISMRVFTRERLVAVEPCDWTFNDNQFRLRNFSRQSSRLAVGWSGLTPLTTTVWRPSCRVRDALWRCGLHLIKTSRR